LIPCLLIFIHVEDHFVDNEQEAYEFINSGAVKNTTAFLMPMSAEDVEQNCTGVQGSNSMFEFR
jgi:hypothetical protein